MFCRFEIFQNENLGEKETVCDPLLFISIFEKLPSEYHSYLNMVITACKVNVFHSPSLPSLFKEYKGHKTQVLFHLQLFPFVYSLTFHTASLPNGVDVNSGQDLAMFSISCALDCYLSNPVHSGNRTLRLEYQSQEFGELL